MSEFTFLTEEQIFGIEQLDIIKKYGSECAITDFSILLGGYVSDSYISEENSREEHTSWWWTKSIYDSMSMRIVDSDGYKSWEDNCKRYGGARPAIPYSSISNDSANAVRGKNGILEVEYGEYPQTIVSEDFAETLERAYLDRTINQTGKNYATDSVSYGWRDEDIKLGVITHIEYEYNGRKYIRLEADSNCKGKVLSDGRKIQYHDIYWVEVEPIKWMIDERTNIALSKKIIFSGVQFSRKKRYIGDFNRSDIKRFMDECFSKDIIPSMDLGEKKRYEEKYPSLDSKKQIEEENRRKEYYELIKGAIDCDVPLFLHGQSIESKHEFMKRIDQNYEIINMRNETLDSFIGKNQDNESVPPAWYTRIVEKCRKEPNEIHIVLFDELTKAQSSIQDEVNNIILTRKINGVWSLPENVRIVASENEIEESYATNPPIDSDLYNYVNVYVKDKYITWLDWANDNNIHPVIFAFLAYKREDMLRNKNKDTIPKSEPKKWELASKMLYKTNNPMALRAILGEDITKEFIEFNSLEVMKLEPYGIIDNYLFRLMPNSTLRKEFNLSKKYALAMKLSQVDEYLPESVRELVQTLCGEGACKLYEALWSRQGEPKTELEEELPDAPEVKRR